MAVDSGSDKYREGLDLAEAGKYEEALERVQEHLRDAPDDAQVLNDMGAILHCLGRSEEAIGHFEKARNLQGDSAEIVWNLAETYLAVSRPSEAMQLFDDMKRRGILSADILNRTANEYLNQDKLDDALKMLLWSLQVSPDQEVLKPMIEEIRRKINEDSSE
jgi:pentatricopeptide repeat protein